MKLVKAVIYGFGKWVDHPLDFTAASPLVIYGENESGKSTIQQFLLFMLFGLPPKQRAFYRPKNSGRMGGRLTIDIPGTGVVTIERLDEARNGKAVCHGPEGEEYPEEWLEDRLHGMTLKTYQSIYSFSALDLNGLSGMKENDFGEVLFGIGLTGSQNLYTVEKRLEQQMAALFKPYGKKPSINEQLNTLDGITGDLRRFKEREGSYLAKKEEKHQEEEKISRLKSEIEQLKEQLSNTALQQQALPMVKKYRTYTEQLKGFPSLDIFPEKGRERLEKLKEKLLPLQSEQALLEDNMRKYRVRMEELKGKLKEESVYERADQVLRHKEGYLNALREQERISAAVEKKKTQLDAEVQRLHVGLSVEELSSLEFPFHLEKTWSQTKMDAEQLRLEEERIKQEYQELKQQRNYLLNQAWEAEEGTLSESEYQELTEKLSGYKEKEMLLRLQSGAEYLSENWRQQKAKQEQRSNLLLTVSFTIAALLAVIGALFGQSALFWMIPILLLAGIGQKMYSKSHIASMDHFFTEEAEQSATLDLSEEERREAEQAVTLHEQRSSELTAVKEQLKTVDIQFIKLDEKRRGIEEKRRRVDALISEQHESYPFLEQVEIAYWPEFYHYIKKLLDIHSDYRLLQQEKGRLDQSLDENGRPAMAFCEDQNLGPSSLDPLQAFRLVEELMEHRQQIIREINQYEKLAEDNRRGVEETRRKAGVYQEEIEELLNAAEVGSEEAYYRKARQVEEKRKLEEEAKRLKDQLHTTFPDEMWKRMLTDMPEEQALENTARKGKETLRDLEEELNRSRQHLADMKAAISAVESSEGYSNTLHRLGMEKEKLDGLAHQWSVLKTAKEMLEKTKKTYRDKYLHQVMETASHYFSIITGKHYVYVYPPMGDTPFQAEARDGVRYKAEELSQGTINQLYISLRLAIGDIMSDKHSLPFIIDDAFVHFDTIRTKRILDILGQQNQQVILFTCREEVRDHASFTIRIHG
ncbi:AAA family ATPase [Virgibacillus xinjiangensis]|uniref:AAA family ATPase n=1 Tax=Virgibacillus xinjiangensis TaxID=393090 RepID=A0ABV7CWF9_9BACI